MRVDSLGRRVVAGPAGGLEAVTMLAMALPIVLVGLLSAKLRSAVLYAIAACLLVAAMFATGRKSALIAPVAVVLTLAYFRRRELLTLAPLGPGARDRGQRAVARARCTRRQRSSRARTARRWPR